MPDNRLEFYRKSDSASRNKILITIFAEKLILKNGKVADLVFTEPIHFIPKIGKILKTSDNEKYIQHWNWLI